jgi:hypothetical protein
MLRFARFVKRSPSRTLVFLLFLIILLIIIISLQHTYVSYELSPIPPSNLTQYDQFCWRVAHQSLPERLFRISQHLTSRNETIPYSYNHWNSSSIMPRPLTTCEHALFIHLLSVLVKNVFDKYNITYMMMAGTLLGSYF